MQYQNTCWMRLPVVFLTIICWLCSMREVSSQDSSELAPAKSIPVLAAVPSTETPAKALAAGGNIQQVDSTAPIAAATSPAALAEKQQQVTSKLRVALLQEQADKATEPADAQPEGSESEVDLLKQVDVIIAQQQAATSTLQDIEATEGELKLQLAAVENGDLAERPPYSIMLLDQLRDSIKSLTTKEVLLESSRVAAREAVERARRVLDEKQRITRQLKEQNPNADLRVPQLEIQLAEEILVLRRQELAIEDASERVRAQRLKIDEKKIEIIRPHVIFSKEMLDKQISDLEAREFSLKRKADSLQTELQFAERRWLVARQEVDSTPTPGPELLERVEALKTSQQSIQQELTVTNQRLQRFPMIKTVWERRYRIAVGSASRNDRKQWLEETTQQIEQLTRERRSRQMKIDEVRGLATAVNARLEAAEADKAELARWLETRQTALAKQAEILTSSMLAIDTATGMLSRLQIQIEGEKGRTISEWIADGWNYLGRIWNYELAHTEDASITVGEVVSSILLLFLGFFAAKWISGLLARRLPLLGVDEAGVSVIESLSFYALLVAFGLTALRYANVPLTVFTFLGGAIAIGVGFGSQNILNNFISGLILMAERPIKKGDLIQLDDMYGNVTKIGARSTQIRTGENLDIVVPNSKFLENNVTNLTRRDDRLRTRISVGVSYGSPLDQVMLLLKQAAVDSPDVQQRPEPMIWFTDFGDNALVFQVNFWIKARTQAQVRNVETSVRLNIDRLFRENGIVIAFPQRDLHIQTPRPIELRLTGNDESGGLPVRIAG